MMAATEASLRCQIKGGRLCVLHSGKVYDLTDFADKHPGGREMIEKYCGEDVTQVMQSDDVHKHSQTAYTFLDKYYIGEYTAANTNCHRHTNGHTTTTSENVVRERHTNGHITTPERLANGHSNGHANGAKNGYTNGYSNGSAYAHTQQYDELLDWSKPLIWQVGNLGDKYDTWVHSPIDEPVVLFKNPVIEYLSKAYWWTILLYWVPICFYVLYDGVRSFSEQEPVVWKILGLTEIHCTTASVPFLLLLGFFLWTLDEYVVHRWLFHCKPPAWCKPLIALHFLFHGQHHKSPMDKCRLVFPVVPASLLASIIYSFYRMFAPTPIAHVFLAGTIVGYLCYDLIHYYLHHGNPSFNYFKELKTYHVKHHFKTQNLGFGISSKLWDYPFGTLIR